jgi:DNA primase
VTDAKTQVLAATDIVQLIGRTVGLKRRGKDYVGLCPFHQEKSPSFAVNPEKQFFYCYGCKKGGNAIDFVIERDRVEFRDALKILADEARIELPSYGSREKHGERIQLLDAQTAAMKVFRRLFLLDSRGKPAREYMRKRGFTDATLDAFNVGFAADAWDVLRDAPEMKNFAPQMLASAGLLKVREQGGGFYDTFRDRVMFPIRDETNKVIAFGGRILPGGDNPAKYLNSPETPLFSKSRCAYGIDQARQRIVETRTAVIVEGYTDVLMAHQYDVKNVVSVLGTALTEQHVAMLRRFADRIVLLFDADTAGAGAADRSLELFLTQPIEIAIATLPEGKDPDEVLIEQGKPGFEAIIARATPALEYLWARLFAQYASNEGDLTGQAKTIDAFLERLASVNPETTDRMRLSAAMVRASKLTGISTDDLIARIRSIRTASRQQRQPNAPQPKMRAARQRPLTARERAERALLGAILNEPAQWEVVQAKIGPADLATHDLRQLAERLWDAYRNEGALPLNEVLDWMDDALKPVALETAQEAAAKGKPAELAEAAIAFIFDERRREADRKDRSEMVQPTTIRSDDEDADLLRRIQENAKRPDLKRT